MKRLKILVTLRTAVLQLPSKAYANRMVRSAFVQLSRNWGNKKAREDRYSACPYYSGIRQPSNYLETRGQIQLFLKNVFKSSPTTLSPLQYPMEELPVPCAAKSSSSPRIPSSAVVYWRLSSFSSALVRYGIFWA
jgi:hypothetical protein